MENENTAVAVARQATGLDYRPEGMAAWSPDEFKARIERERQMRDILRDYVKSELKAGHHYSDKIGEQQLTKPMLLQEGVRNICSLFTLTFGPPEVTETYLEGGHYRARAHVELFNAEGRRVATGDGICSTLESKYAYRKASRICPECEAETIRKDNRSSQGGWYCWSKIGGCGAKFGRDDERIIEQKLGRVDNPDKGDLENTVLKMSIKRAKTAAVCDVPTISEIFAPGDDDSDDDSDKPGDLTKKAAGGKEAIKGGRASVSDNIPPSPPKETQKDIVLRLVKKLIEKGMPEADIKGHFLPDGKQDFSLVTEAEAEEIVPGLVELLNSTVQKK